MYYYNMNDNKNLYFLLIFQERREIAYLNHNVHFILCTPFSLCVHAFRWRFNGYIIIVIISSQACCNQRSFSSAFH